MQTWAIAATSGGFFKCRGVRPPIPRQQIVDPVSGMFGNARQNIGEPGLRIDIVQFGGLCRPPNYAERFWSNRSFGHSLRAVDGTAPQLHSA
jgi:hypothetical protein